MVMTRSTTKPVRGNNHMKRTLVVVSMVALAVLMAAPAFAVLRNLGTSVAQIQSVDSTALGTSVGMRMYTDCDTGFNKNTAGCLNIRCGNNTYQANTSLDPGGYRRTSESMNPYCG